MGKTKFEHYDRCDLVEDPDWEIAMEVSVKYIAKIMEVSECRLKNILFSAHSTSWTRGNGSGTLAKPSTHSW